MTCSLVSNKTFYFHALIKLTENIKQALDDGYIGRRIFVDYKKLFTYWVMKYCYQNLSTIVFEAYQITGLNPTFLITDNI